MTGSQQNAMDVRMERIDGEFRLLQQGVKQSNENLRSAIDTMSAEVRNMAQKMDSMAPHAQAIATIVRSMEIRAEQEDARYRVMAEEQAKHTKQIEFWRGAVAVLSLVGVGVLGFFHSEIRAVDVKADAINASRDTHRTLIYDEIGKLGRRVDRLEKGDAK